MEFTDRVIKITRFEKGFEFVFFFVIFFFSLHTAGNKTVSALENDVFTSFYFGYCPQISFHS